MKNLSKLIIPMLLMAFTFMGVNESYAQCGTTVGTATLDVNGNGQINYIVGSCTPGSIHKFCAYSEGALCTDMIIMATVTVNGVVVTSGNIIVPGPSLKFQASCGDNVSVTVSGVLDRNCLPPSPNVFTFALDQI